MKLLFDQNLSWRLPTHLADIFPESSHVREVDLKESEDLNIWEFAKEQNFVIVSKDKDFQERSLVYGYPPKVIFLRVGNCKVKLIEDLLRQHSAAIHTFGLGNKKSYLALS